MSLQPKEQKGKQVSQSQRQRVRHSIVLATAASEFEATRRLTPLDTYQTGVYIVSSFGSNSSVAS